MSNIISKAAEVHTLVPGTDGNVLFSAGSESIVQMWDLRAPRKPAIELEK